MKKSKVFCVIMAVCSLFAASLCTGCSIMASSYSEEQHMQRIRERAEERFLGEGSEYTGLEVYPIYNEYDELKYALIEFEPQGFLYVHIGERAYPWKGMYTLDEREPESWMPYRVKEGATEEVTDENGHVITFRDREFFRDENGDAIIYHQSHFKVAGIENERRYIVSIVSTVPGLYGGSRIPAVKRGEQYLNLVDGNLMDYEPGMESATYAVANIIFISKSAFDL